MKGRVTRRFVVIIVLTLLLLLFGCFSKAVQTSQVGGDIEVAMWASNNCTQPGDTVRLRATATNRGRSIWTVELKDQPVFDILTSNEKGEVRWSDGKPLSDLTRLELKPGESRSIEMDLTVPQSLKVGFLSAEARYFYSATAPGGPVQPGVTIYVGDCRAFGP